MYYLLVFFHQIFMRVWYVFILNFKASCRCLFINYRHAIQNNQKYTATLKEIIEYTSELNESIKEHNKKIEKFEKKIDVFYKQMSNYHHMNGEKEKSIKFNYVYKEHKGEVIDSINKQKKVLEDIIDQYQKDLAESDAKTKKIINYKGCNIIIRKGNLTEEKEDAIVNPTNEDLHHRFGAAKIIAQKGGEVIQKESEEYIKKYGNLLTGEAATTNAGDLLCEKVIHVVGPIYPNNSMRDQKQREELRSAVKNILREMRKYKINSVSFPAISTGIFRFPLELCAMIIGDVLKEAIDNDPEFYKNKRLVICNHDEKTTNKMLEYIPNSFTEIGMIIFINVLIQH